MNSANEIGEKAFCRNCGSAVEGEYCANCGQREGRQDRYFSEILGDGIGDVFSRDSRFWRTLLPLLFRPGFLSAEFFAGRRARYMPPFRMYLVVSFVTFLIISFGAENRVFLSDPEDVNALDTLSGELSDSGPSDAQIDAAKPQENSDTVSVSTSGNAIPGNVSDEKQDVDGLSTADNGAAPESPIEADLGANDPSSEFDFGISVSDDAAGWQRALATRLNSNAKRVSEDSGAYAERLIDSLPQLMFLMLPVFALILKLLYVFTPFHYLQHLVFALHVHSFAYLLYLLTMVTDRLSINLDATFITILLLYLLIAMRTAYGSSWLRTGVKAGALSLSYGLLLLISMSLGALAVLLVM